MKTALVLIATGDYYRAAARRLIETSRKYFVPHDVILFTDRPSVNKGDTEWPVKKVVQTEALGYPRATLMRYHTVLTEKRLLSEYDYIFYSDVDMLFVGEVQEIDIFSDGITATEHPGYVGLAGTPETDPRSAAFCPRVRTYFCGGFNGGTSTAYLAMAETIRLGVDADDLKGVMAIWHDESHLNRYLFNNPPAKILSPAYCFPQDEYESPGGSYAKIWKRARRQPGAPKLIALEKGKRA